MKAEQDERNQAQNVEMPRHVGAAAPVVDEQADQKIRRADHILVGDSGIERLFPDVDGGLELDASPDGDILRLVPRSHGGQNLGNVNGLDGGGAVDLQQRIAVLETGFGGWPIRIDVQGFHAVSAIDPNGAVVGQAELVLLFEIDDGRGSGGDRQDRQDRGGELKFEFLKHLH
ncbi:MAG: hypothetical protein ABSH24_11075 [Bryobacteraceae bacterium]